VRSLLRYLSSFMAQLALPIVIGAPVCLYFFSDIFGYILPFYVPLAASFAVLGVYLLDHLMDIKKEQIEGIKVQQFTLIAKYTSLFRLLALVFLAAALVLVLLFFRGNILRLASLPALLTVAYYTLLPLLKNTWKVKVELVLIAIVVTFSIAVIPALLGNSPNWLWILLFFVICLQNLLLFAWLDFNRDSKTNKESIATIMGIPFVAWVFDILFVVSIAILADNFQEYGADLVPLLFLAMQFYLLVFRVLIEKNKPIFEWRFWVDAVFLIPILYWI
jgi:4-hydroxybenzoate polyprenyltransferase